MLSPMFRARRLTLVACLTLLAGCAAPAPVANPTAIAPLPTSIPAAAPTTPPTQAPVVIPTPVPSPTVQLQSQQDGPVAEAVLAQPAQPAAAPPPPLPRETITPAESCDPNRAPTPLGTRAPGGFSSFRAPLPATPLWNPPGTKRVGIQVGHWRNEEVPTELGRLQGGAIGGGKQEWEVNLDIAQRTQRLLEAEGYEVDLLPAAVPIRYQANAFVAIHADGDTSGTITGYKIARPGFSSIPQFDDRLVEALYASYGPATGLRRDDEHISVRMLYYYAFNSRRYCHAVAPGVPQAIVETGFLTSAADRRLLIGNPDAAARGIAGGLDAFLSALP